jgi:hypothetical protein
MPDPTGARMRTLNAFFDSPRFPIKELPRSGKDRERDDDDRVRPRPPGERARERAARSLRR